MVEKMDREPRNSVGCLGCLDEGETGGLEGHARGVGVMRGRRDLDGGSWGMAAGKRDRRRFI